MPSIFPRSKAAHGDALCDGADKVTSTEVVYDGLVDERVVKNLGGVPAGRV
jgi:hypothetical protein